MKHRYVNLFGFIIIMSLVLLPAISEAQMPQAQIPSSQEKQPSPEEMEMMMAGMGAGMAKMMENMLDMMFGYLAKKETAVKAAAFTKNYYDELVKQGFAKEDALRIVAYSGLPTMSMMK